MATFLFRFGFQGTPIWGSDSEDSTCIWIEAESIEEALAWGVEVATAFVAHWWPDLPPWRECSFAHGIEDKAEVLRWATENAVPKVKCGEYPRTWDSMRPSH
jgi:hypothetical protein